MGATRANASPRSGANAVTRRSAKSTNKPSLVVKLSLSPTTLGRIASGEPPQTDPVPAKSSTSQTSSTPAVVQATEASPAENGSEASATPAPNVNADATVPEVAEDGSKKKATPASKSSKKRTTGVTQPAISRIRGRPGPKKKGRLDDGTGENGETGPAKKGSGVGNSHSGPHRLGPKANQGAINAGLRALDRSGRPCRRWEKKGFQVRSFTGVSWQVPTWRSPKPKVVEEPKPTEEAAGQSQSANSDGKENKATEVLPSEKSSSAVGVDMEVAASNGVSSPAPLVAASA
ncbi:MAG: hypothetical protein M1816_003540 [Peltula sp. TS41687]|nr:MAG: hypothetical protein M1816_003540 [Peltula sp. TS41687]